MTVQQILLIIFAMGLYHGINPAMGWLLAASQGLQKKSFRTLLEAIGALAVGHLAAVILAVFGYIEMQKFISKIVLECAVATLLIGFGIYHLVKRGHTVRLGMKSGLTAVAFWSFLIATAHGAGVMLLPFVGTETTWPLSFLIITVHTLGYLTASSFAALFLYSTLNLQLLKNAWINFDLFWAYSLLLTGLFFIFFFLI